MDKSKIIQKLNKKYPDKEIIIQEKDGKIGKIICDAEPTSDHSEWSMVSAFIIDSEPHHHNHTTEEYTVIEGILELHIGKEIVELKEGKSYTISPGIIHWGRALGEYVWIECTMKPGWSKEDYIVE